MYPHSKYKYFELIGSACIIGSSLLFYLILNFAILPSIFLSINIVTFLLCGIDKRFAMNSYRRIPEITFIALASLSGTLGLILGMIAFRHKTKKISFLRPLTVVVSMQIVMVLYFLG